MATTNFSAAGMGYVKYTDPYLYNCVMWDSKGQDAYFDGLWRFGKAMGFIAGILGLVFIVLSTILCCMRLPRLAVQIMAGVYLVLGFCSILMLVGLASDVCNNACQWTPPCTQCTLSMAPGARMAIVAFFLFAGAGVTTYCMKEKEFAPDQDEKAKDEEQAVPDNKAMDEEQAVPESALHRHCSIGTTIDVVEKLNDDGTKTVTTTTTNPDGTRAIHTTIESVA